MKYIYIYSILYAVLYAELVYLYIYNLRDICLKDATASLLFKNTKLEFELTENLQGYAIQVKEGRRGMTNQLLIFCCIVIY